MDSDRLYNRLWEEMVYANMRANFFGELVRVYQNWDKWLRLGVLVLSSGSAATTLASLPIELRLALPVLATGASLWLFVSQYSTMSRDASDLNTAWEEIASRYEYLFNHLHEEGTEESFYKVFESAGKLSSKAAKFPQSGKRLLRCEKGAESILIARYA
jgi:hypothetical protein